MKLSEDEIEWAEDARRHLGNFVEYTSLSLILDQFQWLLCARLEMLKDQCGQRIMIHAPPQVGKSVIVAQRLIAWLLGWHPEIRTKLACYNIRRAIRHGSVLLQTMQSDAYKRVFMRTGDLRASVPTQASNEMWSTAERSRYADAQPSFAALGLQTGFVGDGVDLLVIDDPYSSPAEAMSIAANSNIQSFYNEGASVRFNDKTNVILMFHRYWQGDIAGHLWEQGGWEMWRFPAIGDENTEWPDRAADIRGVGEKLTQRLSDEVIERIQKTPRIWNGQFMGVPLPSEGAMFQPDKMEIKDFHELPKMKRIVRAWDMASSAGKGDFTVGAKLGIDIFGGFWVLDVVRGQWSTDERNLTIRRTAEIDGREVEIHGAQDPGAAGKDAALSFVRMLAVYRVKTETVSGAKELRADGYSAQVNAGNVRLLRGLWNREYIEELRAFPLGRHDDQVDASSDAFNELAIREALPVGRPIYKAVSTLWNRV